MGVRLMLTPMSDSSKGSNDAPPMAETESKPQVFQAATAMFAVPSQMAQQVAEPALEPVGAASDQIWHVVIGAAQEGPLSLAQLAQKLAAGAIDAKALVWRPTMASWAALDEVPELQALLPHAPAAQSPAPASALSAELSPEAGDAMTALMSAGLKDMEASPREPEHAPVSELAGADLFGNSETAFLQAPNNAPQELHQPMAPAPTVLTSPDTAQRHNPSLSATPGGRRPLWIWAAVSAALGALVTGGYWLTRTPPSEAPPAILAPLPVHTPSGLTPKPSQNDVPPHVSAPEPESTSSEPQQTEAHSVKPKGDAEGTHKTGGHRRNRGHRRGRHHSH
jgi:hypothetical protein